MNLYQRYNNQKGMVVVKKYRDAYKLTIHKSLNIKGLIENKLEKVIEINGIKYKYDDDIDYENIQVYVDDLTGQEYYTYDIKHHDKIITEVKENPEKLANNISRSRATIYELAVCNDWDFFVTLTLDKQKYDRYDLKKFHKDLTQKIRDLNKKYNLKEEEKIKFLFIPEQHKDGAWHMHGFIKGLPKDEVIAFEKSGHVPMYILDKLIKGESCYYWKTYSEKFGFSEMEEIKNIYKASAYITKYVSKGLSENVKELNAQVYYCSRGLNRAREVIKGYIDMPEVDNLDFNYTNEYVKVRWMDKEEYENVKLFIDKEIE